MRSPEIVRATLALFSAVAFATPLHGTSQWPILPSPQKNQHSGIIQQNDTLCDAGSRHWTGTVPLGGDRDMFFWYFESRTSPGEAPLIVWLNGGPGASSLLGAFHEIGPCRVSKDGQTTAQSSQSWTEFANMLFVDQPIGVGFSNADDPLKWTRNLAEGAIDLDKFLDTFLTDHFPSLRERPIHLAGESFGGKYCPVYADLMRRRFDSMILVDAMVDLSSAYLGIYDHFCTQRSSPIGTDRSPPWNASACDRMAELYSPCEYYGRLCQDTYHVEACQTAMGSCMDLVQPYFEQVVSGGQNPYDDRQSCIEPPVCGRLGMEEVATYLNLGWVQKALDFEAVRFNPVNFDFNLRWSTQGDVSLPATREIARLLDVKETPILVINGNNDVVVNTEGVVMAYDSILWSGHAVFRSMDLKEWHYLGSDNERALGGRVKSYKNLSLVTVEGAGHMAPHDQPEAVGQVLRSWTRSANNFNLGDI